MHSPDRTQELAHLRAGFVAVAVAQDVDHAGEHRARLGVGDAGGFGDRAGLEALAALGAGVGHRGDAVGKRGSRSVCLACSFMGGP